MAVQISNVVTMNISGRLLSFPAAYLKYVGTQLSYTHRYVKHQRGDLVSEMVPVKLYKMSDGHIYTFRGFKDRLKNIFEKYGLSVVFDPEYAPPKVNIDVIPESITLSQLDILDSIFSNQDGVYEAPTGYGKTFLLKILCQAYPDSRIVITSKSRDVVRNIYDEIKYDIGHRALNCCLEQGLDERRRIILIPSWSLPKLDALKYDILLYDEVHTAAENVNFKNLLEFHNCRFYGFSATPEKRQDLADKRIEALFGPIRVKISYQTALEEERIVPVNVHIYKVDVGRELLAKAKKPYSYYVRQKFGIWYNSYRNRLIADLARRAMSYGHKVLILVEKIKHAQQIQKFCPSLVVAHASIKNLPAIYHAFKDGKIQGIVATSVFSTGINIPDLKVLIFAGGTTSYISVVQSIGRSMRRTEDKEIAYVIDFLDAFEETLVARSWKRIKTYKQKGWLISHGELDFSSI